MYDHAAPEMPLLAGLGHTPMTESNAAIARRHPPANVVHKTTTKPA